MKKNLRLITFTIIYILINCVDAPAQNKRPKKSTSKAQSIEIKAKNWFKVYYVPLNFKDPYSYKILKCFAIPISNKEALKETYETLTYNLKDLDTAGFGNEYKNALSNYRWSLKKHNIEFKGTDTTDKRYQISIQSLKYENEKIETMLKKFTDTKSSLDTIRKILSTLSPEEEKKIAYYKIYLDCYSNNSYGNKVLGRFMFLFNNNGVVQSPIQLNNY